ncbi:MAG TPA: hypothetical protein VK906_09150 [Egicoccus sp.]|nr:hypothetical protein [Egicoccus sp.]HSK23329.1 hypothetical protein [Egicoccus sp.]
MPRARTDVLLAERSPRPSAPTSPAAGAVTWRPWTLGTVLAVAVGAGAASVAGLVVDGLYRGPTVVAEGLRGGDLVTALGVVPALLALGPAAARGSRRALPAVLGLLAYLVYTYAYYVFAAQFNALFLLHAAVFAGAGAATGLVLRDAGAPKTVDPPPYTRAVAVLLVMVGASLLGMLVTALVRFAAAGDLPTDVLPYPEWRVHLGYALDLTMTTPALFVAAVGLWRRTAWGVLCGSAVTLWLAAYQFNYLASHLMLARADVAGVSLDDPRPYAMVAVFVVAAAALLRPATAHRSLGS